MKKYKKLFVSLLAAAVLTVGSAFSVMAADTYTYKVTVYAGNKGTIDGQEQKEITGLSLGSQVILDINSVKVTDDKYYVKGFRLSDVTMKKPLPHRRSRWTVMWITLLHTASKAIWWLIQ